MVEKLVGHWKLERNENFDDFMKSLNVNFVLRKVGNKITSYEEITRDGDDWMIHITSTFKSTKLTFKLNEPFTETTLDGRVVTTEFSIQDDKLVATHTPTTKDDFPARYERQVVEDGHMVLTCTCIPKNIVATRHFQPYEPSSR